MPLLSSVAVLRLVDSMAILLSQAYQLARARTVHPVSIRTSLPHILRDGRRR